MAFAACVPDPPQLNGNDAGSAGRTTPHTGGTSASGSSGGGMGADAGATSESGATGTAGTSDGGRASGGASAGTRGDDGGSDGDSGAAGASDGGSSAAGSGGSAGQDGDAGEGGSPSGGTGATAGGGSGGTAGATGGPTFHIFLLLGQSNMAGYPAAAQADRAEDPRVRVLGFDNCASTGRQTDVWDTAAPPLHNCYTNAIGPGDYFAKTLIDNIPEGDTIGLVPCAINGERIETFLKVGGTKYQFIIDRAHLAQDAGGVIEGMLFHQGESNNGDSTWPGKVNTLVTDLRTDLGLGNVPFLAGELARDGACALHNTQVNRLPGIVTNSYVISSEGLTVDPADTQYDVHFGHDSQVEFGKRYAATMLEALGW